LSRPGREASSPSRTKARWRPPPRRTSSGLRYKIRYKIRSPAPGTRDRIAAHGAARRPAIVFLPSPVRTRGRNRKMRPSRVPPLRRRKSARARIPSARCLAKTSLRIPSRSRRSAGHGRNARRDPPPGRLSASGLNSRRTFLRTRRIPPHRAAESPRRVFPKRPPQRLRTPTVPVHVKAFRLHPTLRCGSISPLSVSLTPLPRGLDLSAAAVFSGVFFGEGNRHTGRVGAAPCAFQGAGFVRDHREHKSHSTPAPLRPKGAAPGVRRWRRALRRRRAARPSRTSKTPRSKP